MSWWTISPADTLSPQYVTTTWPPQASMLLYSWLPVDTVQRREHAVVRYRAAVARHHAQVPDPHDGRIQQVGALGNTLNVLPVETVERALLGAQDGQRREAENEDLMRGA